MPYDEQDKKTGAFPDFYEYDTKRKDGEVYKHEPVSVPIGEHIGYDYGQSTEMQRWKPAGAPTHGKIREDYDPHTGGRILKQVILRYSTDDINSTHNTGESGYDGSNRQVPHYGGDENWGGEGRREPGLYCYFTPTKSDSLIKMEAKFSTYWFNSSWCIYVWAFAVGGQKVAHGRKQAHESSHTDHWWGHCNSWGAGVQQRVEFLMNSDNTSHYTGIHAATDPWSDREFIITEYENMNPYGDAVMDWRYDNIHF